MKLSGQQRRELEDALIDAFSDTASLERMLAYELDKNLRAIAGEGSLQDIVFKLIQAANAQGWVEDLIRAALKANPGNQDLQIVAQELLRRSTAKPSTQQQKNRRGLAIPIVMMVVGATSVIVVWISKIQSPPTTQPSASYTPQVASSPTTPPVNVPTGETPPFTEVVPEQPRSFQAAYPYFKPCNAETFHVIVASGFNESEKAFANITSLRNNFPQFRFKLWSTVAPDGVSNKQYAIIVGHGLDKTEADDLVAQVKSAGVAPDAYVQLQGWVSGCFDHTRVEN